MSATARALTIAGIPALRAAPAFAHPPLRTVLWFHGFRADALAHAAELERCARAGFLAVGIDAVGHGARADARLAPRMAALGGALPVMLDLVDRTIDELPAVIDALELDHGADRSRLAMVGISMGAFLVYRSISAGIRVRAAVAALGAPRGIDGERIRNVDPFRDVALLSITAEHDRNVPPQPVHDLHSALEQDSESAGAPATHRHVVLRGSGHLTSADDWETAMRHTISWLGQHG